MIENKVITSGPAQPAAGRPIGLQTNKAGIGDRTPPDIVSLEMVEHYHLRSSNATCFRKWRRTLCMANDVSGLGRLALGEFLPYRLSVLAESIGRSFVYRYEKTFGITNHEWRIMAVLGERSPRQTREVIESTRMDRVRVSRAVIRLVNKGLVRRTPVPRDQRAHTLELTPLGEATYGKIVPLARKLQCELVEGLGKHEMGLLCEIIGKLQRAADAMP